MGNENGIGLLNNRFSCKNDKGYCHHVAMESTGIYWKAVYAMLEDSFDGNIEILLVNAQKIKNVPGRKTDVKDSEWIASLLRSGLLSGSFIPEKEIFYSIFSTFDN